MCHLVFFRLIFKESNFHIFFYSFVLLVDGVLPIILKHNTKDVLNILVLVGKLNIFLIFEHNQ